MKQDSRSLKSMKARTPISMLTAYTCPVARCIERAGIPVILVGDTLGMVEMGHSTTREVTMDHMVYHISAVRRGAPQTHIIGDMPYNSDNDPDSALQNARLLIEAGADSIKLEGPKYDVIERIIAAGIDVVGHTGLTPQTSVNFKQVGNKAAEAERILQDAAGIAGAGVFMLVLEHIPSQLARDISAAVDVPTIGIGAGPHCDGQVLVINDAIGMGDYWPPFSKQYAHVGEIIEKVATDFRQEVEQKLFPGK